MCVLMCVCMCGYVCVSVGAFACFLYACVLPCACVYYHDESLCVVKSTQQSKGLDHSSMQLGGLWTGVLETHHLQH